jgi:hypothetical protein
MEKRHINLAVIALRLAVALCLFAVPASKLSILCRPSVTISFGWITSSCCTQKWQKSCFFIWERVAVIGRAVFNNVSYVNIRPFKPYAGQHFVQKLARCPYKRQPLLIFVFTRRFAYKNNVSASALPSPITRFLADLAKSGQIF